MSVHKVSGDGNCLFNSIAYGIIYHTRIEDSLKNAGKLQSSIKIKKPSKTEYKQLAAILRKESTNYMSKKIKSSKGKNFAFMLAGTYAEENNINNFTSKELTNDEIQRRARKYIKVMKQDGEWAGEIELISLTNFIHELGFKGVKVTGVQPMETKIKMSKPMPIIDVRWSGRCHYDFLAPRLKRTPSSVKRIRN